MAQDILVTQEAHAFEPYLNEIDLFWQSGNFSSFQGAKDITINYAYFIHKSTSPTIVISPGRGEGYLKYKEVIYDLYKNNYNIFIIDHRGQGISQRSLKNNHKGYVDNFDLYVDDLYNFITSIVSHHVQSLPYLLAHSMGCAIALRMFQLYPKVVSNAVLLSPMIAINSGVIPYSVASCIIAIGQTVNEALGGEPWYFLGQSNYKATPFSKNVLTHSQGRYKQFIDVYNANKNIQLGGVTFHWLTQAIKNENNIFNDINKTNTPLVIIQAGNDLVVNNPKQNIFCQQLNKQSKELCTKKPITIPDANHELLFETDTIRNKTFRHILEFFTPM